MKFEERNSNDETERFRNEPCRLAFAGFLHGLAATKGRVDRWDWDEFAVTHCLDDEME